MSAITTTYLGQFYSPKTPLLHGVLDATTKHNCPFKTFTLNTLFCVENRAEAFCLHGSLS